MKLREFKGILDQVVEKNHLTNPYFAFHTECTVAGTTSYVPAGEYGNGIEPPDVFAKEYKWERSIDVKLDVYAADKKNGKFVIYVGTCEDFDEECDWDAGIEFDGGINSEARSISTGKWEMHGLDEVAEKLKLTGDEEVVLNYAGKEYPMPKGVSAQKASVERSKWGKYDQIWFMADFEPTDVYQEWRAEQIGQDIDPEQEMDDARNWRGGDGEYD